MKYFTGTTAEQIRKEYIKLAKALHPDNGGDAEKFKEMQAEFTIMWARYKNVHENKSGETFECSENSEKAEHKTASRFMSVIDIILAMGCDVNAHYPIYQNLDRIRHILFHGYADRCKASQMV